MGVSWEARIKGNVVPKREKTKFPGEVSKNKQKWGEK